MTFLTWALIAALAAAPAGQSSSTVATAPASQPAEGQTAKVDTDALPVSVDRIQRRLAKTPQIRPSEVTPVFRVEVIGELPPIEVLLGPDYAWGKAPGGGMTHQEFLMFTQKEAITVMATSFALKWALQKAIQKYRSATQAREREAARKEVEEALEALDKARAAAGLPKR
jgi:hypothetical protein